MPTWLERAGWVLLLLALMAALALIFLGYLQPGLLLDYLILRYCA